MSRFAAFDTYDVRFPTSRTADGSDAMNTEADYSAAYVVARTDGEEDEGHGFAFTIGRGNDVQLAAIREVAGRFIGRDLSGVLDDLGETWRELVHDSQLRWLGPEKGVMHMAIGAVVNALWDLRARIAGVPLWPPCTPEGPTGSSRPRRAEAAVGRGCGLGVPSRALPSSPATGLVWAWAGTTPGEISAMR